MSDAKHTPTPLTFRLHKNGRDFEIVCEALRSEWVGTELGQDQVIATLSIGNYTDATGAARELNEANAAFIVKACNEYESLTSSIEAMRGRLTERIEWLRKEANHGGNWEYLKAKWEECERIREQLRTALASKDSP